MWLYHGTSKKSLKAIEREGVMSPSYWTNDFEMAKGYASSFGDGVVLMCDSRRYDFKANMQVAQCLLDEGEIESLPNEDDLQHSLAFLEGIVCQENISDFEVVTQPMVEIAKKPTSGASKFSM